VTDDLTEAARRGLQRAGVHLMKAAVEVVEGINAFLEELNGDAAADAEVDANPDEAGDGDESEPESAATE
jgi:hypothetical protein